MLLCTLLAKPVLQQKITLSCMNSQSRCLADFNLQCLFYLLFIYSICIPPFPKRLASIFLYLNFLIISIKVYLAETKLEIQFYSPLSGIMSNEKKSTYIPTIVNLNLTHLCQYQSLQDNAHQESLRTSAFSSPLCHTQQKKNKFIIVGPAAFTDRADGMLKTQLQQTLDLLFCKLASSQPCSCENLCLLAALPINLLKRTNLV